MLSEARNRLLTEVGPGTPMGELLRRYWHADRRRRRTRRYPPTKPVRLLGEDLVLYKDLAGHYGLLDRHCPHRRADLRYGIVEECGLRCNYHGWLFDADGRCREQPFEDIAAPEIRFRDQIRIKRLSRRAQRPACSGPISARSRRRWCPTGSRSPGSNGFGQVVFSDMPCNWFQCQENSIDPVHFEWMHANWRQRLAGSNGPYAPRHTKLGFDEFDYGFVYRRVREDTDEASPLWTVGRVCLWPNALFTGNHFEWRVPIDDANTLSVGWFFRRVPQDREPYVQNTHPDWHGPINDAKHRALDHQPRHEPGFRRLGRPGRDRRPRREHLGRSDRGVIMIRQRFLERSRRDGGRRRPKAIDPRSRGEPLCHATDHRPPTSHRGCHARRAGSNQGIRWRRHSAPGVPLSIRPAGRGAERVQ